LPWSDCPGNTGLRLDVLPCGPHWFAAMLSKPQACPEARGVDVRMALSRGDDAAPFGAAAPHA